MQRGLRLPSGRVISVGRYLLATLFFLAIWLDVDPPFERESDVGLLLAGYVVFALVLVAATWKNWWLDARLAGPAHAADILVFTALVAFTEGFDSPYFTFFTFLLLAAAIRWGWRATILTAILLMSLYLMAGMIVSATRPGPWARRSARSRCR